MLFFLLGLVFGSFFNSLIFRLEKNNKIILTRSYCPSCFHSLNFLDLIPLISFIFLKGKCRYCHQPISFIYPLGELLTAFLFLSFYLRFKELWSWHFNAILFFILWLGFLSCLFLLAYYDLKTQYLSDKILIFSFLWAVFFLIAQKFTYNINFLETLNIIFPFDFKLRIFFSIVLTLFLGSLAFLNFIGWGDVIVIFWLNIFLKPPEIFLSLIIAGLLGTLYSLPFLFFKKYNLKTQLPFLPFIFLGVWFTIILGESLMKVVGL